MNLVVPQRNLVRYAPVNRVRLDAAWFEGIDITRDKGLQTVAANAGLEWQPLQASAQAGDWEPILERNLTAMLEADLWGVPSFRVSGGKLGTAYVCWGQDRIWRVENEIARRL